MFDDLQPFMDICDAFVKSSEELRAAAQLCDNEVKQDMISFVIPEFEQMRARSEGIKVLLGAENYSQNKEFILEEMKSVTKQNLEMAQKIRETLGALKWN